MRSTWQAEQQYIRNNKDMIKLIMNQAQNTTPKMHSKRLVFMIKFARIAMYKTVEIRTS